MTVSPSISSWVAAAATLGSTIILLGHAGFALYESGLSRAKNASHAMAINATAWALAGLGFFVCGFALLSGGAAKLSAGKLWFLGGVGDEQLPTLLMFLLMFTRITIAASLTTGAAAERWRFKHFAVVAILLGAVVLPIYGSWIWADGWLARLGTAYGWTHGAIDYAGSSVVHLQGGAIAWVFAYILGPRIGKYDARQRPRPILGHHIPMAVVGCLLIGISLLAMNLTASILADDGKVVDVAVASALAAAMGIAGALISMLWRFGKPDPTMLCNGMIAGLVAIAAPCAYVSMSSAAVIGFIAGLLSIGVIPIFETFGLDDPAGSVSVHGMAGAWGMIAMGLFADGHFHSVAGLFYGNGRQLIAELTAVVACIFWGVAGGAIVFKLASVVAGSPRVAREVELSGLDIAEVGVPAYRELLNSVSGATPFVSEPRPAVAPSATGKKRFSVIVEGVDSATLISLWSGFCQSGSTPPSDEFKAVYPYLTTVTGNRFRFSGGDPSSVRDNLRQLFESVLPERRISTRVDA